MDALPSPDCKNVFILMLAGQRAEAYPGGLISNGRVEAELEEAVTVEEGSEFSQEATKARACANDASNLACNATGSKSVSLFSPISCLAAISNTTLREQTSSSVVKPHFDVFSSLHHPEKSPNPPPALRFFLG